MDYTLRGDIFGYGGSTIWFCPNKHIKLILVNNTFYCIEYIIDNYTILSYDRISYRLYDGIATHVAASIPYFDMRKITLHQAREKLNTYLTFI